jgi:hypothetical protein
MQCDDFLNRWQNLLDERLVPEHDELLRTHAEKCGECREFLRVQGVVFAEVERSRGSLPRAEPIVAVLARPALARNRESLPSFSQPVARRTTSSLVLGMAIAGSLFLPGWRYLESRQAAARLQPSQEQVENRAVPAANVSKGANASKGTNPGGGMASHAASSASATNPSPSTPASLNALTDPDSESFDPLDPIAGGIEPLTDTFGGAWKSLCNSLAEPVERGRAVSKKQQLFDWPLWQS